MELHFRAKSVLSDDWLYGDQSLFRNLIDESTIGIWTGLVDRDENRVFEGDILLWLHMRTGEPMGKPCVVKYGVFNCSCCEGVYGWYLDGGDIRNIDCYTVVGNIYDDPDLMEEV